MEEIGEEIESGMHRGERINDEEMRVVEWEHNQIS